MNSSNIVITVIILLILAAGGWVFYMSSQSSAVVEEESEMMEEKQEEEMTEEEQTSSTGSQESSGGDTEVKVAGSYEEYSPEKVSRADEGDVVLFFHAVWCPTCRVLENDIRANVNDIPENVSILKVDYDSETALRQQHGVTFQHTLVQVDAEGNQIAKWSGSPTLSSLLTNVE